MSHCFRAALPALAIVLLSAARAALGAPAALEDVHGAAIGSVKVVANVGHDELGVWSDVALNRVQVLLHGPWGSLLMLGDRQQQVRIAREQAAPLRHALLFHDPRSAAPGYLREELARIDVLQDASFEATGTALLDQNAVREILDAAGTDTVLLIDLEYRLTRDLRYIVVAATATLLPTRAAGSEALKKMAQAPSTEDDLPCPALYRREFVTSSRAPDWRQWKPEQALAAAAAIDGGIAEVARMLAWDLEQFPPASGSYAFTGFGKKLDEFGDVAEWAPAPVRRQDSRQWFRSNKGVLASTGGKYPPPSSAAQPVRIARVIDAVQAASFTPSSAQQAAGRIGAVEIVDGPAARAIQEAKDQAAAKQRAFGSTEAVSADPAAGLSLDRLAGGYTKFAPSVDAYVRTALAAELGKMGIAVAPGRPKLRGEALEAKVERSRQGIAATLRLRCELVDAAGKVVYSDTKAVSTSAEERSETEVDAFHTVLRKAAEALALDPAFAAAVK